MLPLVEPTGLSVNESEEVEGEVTTTGAGVGLSTDIAALDTEEEFHAALEEALTVVLMSSQAAEGSRQLKGVSTPHVCSASTHVHSQQSPPSHSQSWRGGGDKTIRSQYKY